MLKVLNEAEFSAGFHGWIAQCHKGAEAVALNLAVEALVKAVENSPQYSGDYAANWKLSIATPDTTFTSDIFKDRKFPSKNPFLRGDMPAMEHAFLAASGKTSGFKLGQTIWLSNSARHVDKNGATDYYAWKIENNEIKFRNGNNYPETIQTTVDMLMFDYRRISKSTYHGWLDNRAAYERQHGA